MAVWQSRDVTIESVNQIIVEFDSLSFSYLYSTMPFCSASKNVLTRRRSAT